MYLFYVHMCKNVIMNLIDYRKDCSLIDQHTADHLRNMLQEVNCCRHEDGLNGALNATSKSNLISYINGYT